MNMFPYFTNLGTGYGPKYFPVRQIAETFADVTSQTRN